jgi:hypothetical protein
MSVQERLVFVTVDEFQEQDTDSLVRVLAQRAFGTADVPILGCTTVHLHDLDHIALRVTADVPGDEVLPHAV